ncbi:TPA: toprim domain-containing protein [Proteus mirabilis]|nr:toprim domain-containing protein [Proteus mirabilis]
MAPSELSEKLSNDVDRVVRHLFPNGKKQGHEWTVGSLNGEAGDSMKINLSDKNVWCDFATGESGDLLNLWVQARQCSLHQAMSEAKQFLGILDTDHHFAVKKQKAFTRPNRSTYGKNLRKPDACYGYLEGRGISREVAELYKVSDAVVWSHELGRELPAIAFPFERDGKLLQVKRISTERPNGKKIIMAEANCEPCLFGWDQIPNDARSVIICEGEIDCMSYRQYGLSALSVPFGGGKGAKQQWIEFEYHNLERFTEIWLSLDNDEVGREATKEIVSRLGEYRCRLVKLPHKDINECLQAGMTREELGGYLEKAPYFDPEELFSAQEFYQDTWDAIYGKEQYLFRTPWEPMNYNFNFRESELTVLNGVNGHGKTEIAGHIVCEAMRQGVRACVASLELKPGMLLKRLTRQVTCKAKPPELEFESAFKFYEEKLWLFGLTGRAKADRLLEIFYYANRRYGVKLFIVDSLTKVCSDDDYSEQKNFIEALCDFKNRTNSHVILVTHSRKAESEEKPTGKMDVKGTGAITDLADNVMIIWRDKRREKVLEKQKYNALLTDKDLELLAKPGSLLLLEKQRNGEGWEGAIGMYLESNSHQFLTKEKAEPYNYIANMPSSHYEEPWRMYGEHNEHKEVA